MAATYKLTDLTRDIDLEYNASTQPNYKVMYGQRTELEAVNVLQHRPDYGDSLPVRGQDPPRRKFFTMQVFGDSTNKWAKTKDKIITVKRWVDGADQQALRYWTDGDVRQIYLREQLESTDGDATPTLHPVEFGFVDDGASFPTSQYDVNASGASGVVVMLQLRPLGKAATAITLHNDLPSSPHFIEDSDGDGLADGWEEIGTPTTTLDTTNWLIGGKSQKIVTDTAGSDGIKSAVVLMSSSSSVGAYAWVYAVSGDDVTVELFDGADASIESKTASLANSDKTAEDEDGKIWWRIPVEGINSAANAYLQIYRATGDASAATTFFVDGTILYDLAITTPNGWVSTCQIYNRGDVGTELILNGGFETAGGGDPDFWASWSENAGDGTLANEGTIVNSGNDAMKATTGSSADTFATQDFAANPGSSHKLGFYTRVASGDNAGRYTIYDVTNAADIVPWTTTGVSGVTYTLVEDRFTVPATCVSVRIGLASSATDTDIAYFDDVTLLAEDRINYVDTWGIPGDADALVLHKMASITAAQRKIYASRGIDGIFQIQDQDHWLNSSEFSAQASGTGAWVQTSDATRINSSYERFTENAGGGNGGSIEWQLTGATARQFAKTNRRCYMIGRASTTAQTFQLKAIGSFGTIDTEDTASFTTAATWEFLDLGKIELKGFLPDTVPDTAKPALTIRVSIAGTAASSTADIDALLFFHVEDEWIVIETKENTRVAGDLWLDGPNRIVISEETGVVEQQRLGTMWELASGYTCNRIIYATASNVDAHTITYGYDITMDVTPQTRHLLGPLETIP